MKEYILQPAPFGPKTQDRYLRLDKAFKDLIV
jgi:hypothetical protein